MKLSAKQIASLPEEYFGLPKEKRYPMPDKEHVIKAIQFFGYAKPKDRKELANNINRRARELGVTVKVNNRSEFYKYIDRKNVLEEQSDYIEEFHMGSLSPIVPLNGEVMKKPYPNEIDNEYNNRIQKFLNGDDEESFDIVHEIFALKNEPKFKKSQVYPTSTNSRFSYDFNRLLHKLVLHKEGNEISLSYSNPNDIRLRISEINRELFQSLKDEIDNKTHNTELIVDTILSFNNRLDVLIALTYIFNVDRLYFIEIKERIKEVDKEIPYLKLNIDMRLVQEPNRIDDIDYNCSLPEWKRQYGFEDINELELCDILDSNNSIIGSKLNNAISQLVKSKGYDVAYINLNNYAFMEWIRKRIKNGFISEYFINENYCDLFIKLEIEPNKIFKCVFLKKDIHGMYQSDCDIFVTNYICLIEIYDRYNRDEYINLERNLVEGKTVNLKYRIVTIYPKERVVRESIELAKTLKKAMKNIKINSEGDIKIKLTGNESYMDLYDKTHKMIKLNKDVENIEGLKENMAFLFMIISDIETNYIRNKEVNKNSNEYKDAIKARGFAINELKQTMRIVTKHDKKFNFMKYYEEKNFDNNSLTVDKNTIKGLTMLFKTIIL